MFLFISKSAVLTSQTEVASILLQDSFQFLFYVRHTRHYNSAVASRRRRFNIVIILTSSRIPYYNNIYITLKGRTRLHCRNKLQHMMYARDACVIGDKRSNRILAFDHGLLSLMPPPPSHTSTYPTRPTRLLTHRFSYTFFFCFGATRFQTPTAAVTRYVGTYLHIIIIFIQYYVQLL